MGLRWYGSTNSGRSSEVSNYYIRSARFVNTEHFLILPSEAGWQWLRPYCDMYGFYFITADGGLSVYPVSQSDLHTICSVCILAVMQGLAEPGTETREETKWLS